MKLPTAVIIAKGICYLTIGIATPLATSLAQYANTGEWPSRITWWGVVIPACAIGASSQVLAFLSNSFGDYQKKMNGGSELPAVGMPANPQTQPPKP